MNIIINDKKNIFLIYLLVVIGAISLFCLSFNLFKDDSISAISASNTINELLEDVQAINENCSTFYKDNNLNEQKVISNINQIKKGLAKIKSNLNSSDETQKSLINALENNMLIYDQMNAMLQNPTAKDIESSSKNLRTYYSNANSIYSNLGNEHVLKETFYAIEATINYCFKTNDKDKETKIKDNQAALFISSIDTTVSTFEKFMDDLSLLTKQVRNDELTYELAISKVDDKLKNLNEISSDLNNLSIPSKGMVSYDKLKSALNEYNNYLESFKYALSMEKMYSADKNYSSKFFDSLYSTPKEYLNNFNDYYKKFKSSYIEYKSDIL
ncbi:MAG: hypothetical protein ACRCW0_02235 [Clostridium sp.]